MRSRIVATVGAAVVAAVWLSPFAVAQEVVPRTVLTIHFGSEDFPGSSAIDGAIREALQSRADAPVNYYAEYLESEAFPSEPATLAMRDYIRRKFDGRRIDVVIADATPALQFVIRFREELFARVPIVFVAGRMPEGIAQHTAAEITGLLSEPALEETLDLALRLHPSVKRVFVVAQATTVEGYESRIRAALGGFSQRVVLTFVSEPSVARLLATVRAISPPALILYARYAPADSEAVVYADEVGRLVGRASSVPVYGVHDLYIGSGIVGGMMRGSRTTGTRVGQIARQILDGTPPENIPIEPVPLVPTFDWRQLQRWGIDRSRLPVGADVRFRQPSAWELYRWYIVVAGTVVAVQTLLIGGLLAQRARRRLAEASASQLVHELQASETGLRESEARMSLAVDAADLGIWIRNVARNEIWASHRWRVLFGFAPSEPLEFDAILQRLHPDDRENLRQAHAMAFAGANGGRYQTEYRLMLPDGATQWVSSQGRVEFDATGQPALIRGTARDVTARKQAEQETQLLRQEIAHAGRVSMMGQLASGLAHEINQPLAAILRNAEAAELFLQHPSPDLEELRAILSDIRSDDERAGNVIDRMRGLLKRQTLDSGRLDVGALVGDVAALVRIDAATRQVKVDVHVPADLPHVRGDRVQIQQVLLNLILNGMDALDGTRPEARRVDVTARADVAPGGPIVEIAVTDAGAGIPADTLARIFDPFFTTKPNGMGIGLAVSRAIVEAHGGRLWAENRNGGGAAFRFTLPVTEEGAAV